MDNKGFSLIELIIVIAIMAILVAIIAPNLTKYLGSSKQETDNKNLDEVQAQVKNCISDAAIKDYTVIAGSTGNYTLVDGSFKHTNGSNSFGTLLVEAMDSGSTKSKVKPSSNAILITITERDNGGYDVKAVYTQS
jgi:type IV pilus assembly protein PilA